MEEIQRGKVVSPWLWEDSQAPQQRRSDEDTCQNLSHHPWLPEPHAERTQPMCAEQENEEEQEQRIRGHHA